MFPAIYFYNMYRDILSSIPGIRGHSCESNTVPAPEWLISYWKTHFLRGCVLMSDSLRPHGLQSIRLLCAQDSPGKNTGVGCHFLLQGIFPTQRSNPCLLGLLHWQANSLPLCHLGRPLRNIVFNLIGCGKDSTQLNQRGVLVQTQGAKKTS